MSDLQKMIAINPKRWWFQQIELRDGEETLLAVPSNHTQRKWAIGGMLFVTNLRIAFVPNRLDAVLGGLAVEVPLTEITSVSIEPPKIEVGELFSGGLRPRIAIKGSGDGAHLFVVSHPEIAKNRISELVRKHAVKPSSKTHYSFES